MAETTVAGLLLAGGRARRMGGGDKCLLELAGRPMLDQAIARLAPQVGILALNANGDPARFGGRGLPVLADVVPGFAGPLAGVLTGLGWARERGAAWLVTAATDTPFFPLDLVARLRAAARKNAAEVVFAASDGRTHPVFGLWAVGLEDDLRHALLVEEERKIDRFAGRYGVAEADFPTRPFDPFFNVNRPADLAEAALLSNLVDEAAQPQERRP